MSKEEIERVVDKLVGEQEGPPWPISPMSRGLGRTPHTALMAEINDALQEYQMFIPKGFTPSRSKVRRGYSVSILVGGDPLDVDKALEVIQSFEPDAMFKGLFDSESWRAGQWNEIPSVSAKLSSPTARPVARFSWLETT